MIVTVTLNPAWDVTYSVGEFRPGESHRVRDVNGQAGGKGINVSRVLHQMRQPTLVTGIICGATGTTIAADLRRAGIPTAFVRTSGENRRTVTVTDASGTATVLNEPGPEIDDAVWSAFLGNMRDISYDADVVVLAGSVPPGAPGDVYRQLADLAHSANSRCIVDADGDMLAAALAASPEIIKPNRAELSRATGEPSLFGGANAARTAGARQVVVSDGRRGLFSFGEAGEWHAEPPQLTPLNPTGAGDAAVAAIAVGLAQRDSHPELLRRAAAWSAAAVAEPCAGVVDNARIREFTERVRVRQLGGRWETAC